MVILFIDSNFFDNLFNFDINYVDGFVNVVLFDDESFNNIVFSNNNMRDSNSSIVGSVDMLEYF